MKTFTFHCVILVIVMAVASCTEQGAKNKPAANSNAIADSIIGERISGPANIRDTVNGNILFTLYDSTLVTCTQQQDGWYTIGLSMDMNAGEFGVDTLRKGRKITVDGKVVGEILKDMQASISTNTKQSWAELIGYTHKDNIRDFSIIENALGVYIDTIADKTLVRFMPFIKSFQLERDEQFKPFVTFYNYENWVDDPSPMYRVVLVFLENKLAGVVHARPLQIKNTTDHKLERGFKVLFFNDVPKESADNYIQQFNKFVNSVD